MTEEHPRKEEFRVDGEEIRERVKDTFKGRRIQREEIKVQGDQLLSKVREIIHEGNVRRIIIKNSDGVSILEIPLTLGVVGALIAPVWAAIGAVAALAVDYTIVVEKIQEPE